MRLIVTGAAGFIGSHFLEMALWEEINKKNFESIIVIDSLTYASDLKFLKLLQNQFNFEFIKANINDRTILEKVIRSGDIIVNFAAESHVDNSLRDSSNFLSSNVLGVGTLLEVCKNKTIHKFVQISTDEVYGSILNGSWKESQNLDPNSPYSASKAAADLLAISFFRSHKIPIVITRSSNNFGPRQNLEKFVPVVITKILNGKEIPLYGSGENIRDWIFVEDNVRAIWKITMEAEPGNIYHVGGGNEISNLSLIELIGSITGIKPKIAFIEDRKAHDFRYSISTQKIRDELSFHLNYSLEDGLKKTIQYFQKR